jgi:hypothetical protein
MTTPNPVQNQYINVYQFQGILDDLSLQGYSEQKKQDLLNRATADMESDLSKKFVVPLVFSVFGFEVQSTQSTPYNAPPAQYGFAPIKVLNALKEKIREIVGYDKNRNLLGTIENTQKFINVHGEQYTKLMGEIMAWDLDTGFLLNKYSTDAKTPIQHIGLARPDNSTHEDCLDWNNGRDYIP